MGCSSSKPDDARAGALSTSPKAPQSSAPKTPSAPPPGGASGREGAAPPAIESHGGGGGTFDREYVRGEKLGEGAFSVVIEATRRGTSESYAVKVVTKAKLTREDEIALKDEIGVLNELQHKHIIRLYAVLEERGYWFLVTEKMTGGELFDRIVSKSFYNEKEARDVCKILFEAIAFCHSRSVAHRDLKPENLLLRSEESDSDIKIADFGFAKKVLTPNSLKTQCGTPGYVAPEILDGIAYDTQADMWSLGVIIYIILGGYPPFIEQNQRELFRKIRRGQYEFHEEYWGSVSDDAKDLIRSLLTVQPSKRMTAERALQHRWILQDASVLAAQDLGTNLSELRKYNAKRKFKAAVNAVILANKLTSLGANFQEYLDPPE